MMEKISEFDSLKFKILSAFSILGVLYIHMFYSEASGKAILYLQYVIGGDGFAIIAVPIFYVISGFLFFWNVDGLESTVPKIKKRFRTLLIPYLLANILAFIIDVLINVASILSPKIGELVNFKIFSELDQGICHSLVYIFLYPPVAFQLWFVKVLIVIVVISPLIYLVLRSCEYHKFGFLIFLCFSILILGVGTYVDLGLANKYVMALFWFFLGGCFSKFNIQGRVIHSIGFLFLLSFITCCVLNPMLGFKSQTYCLVIKLLGVLGVWFSYDSIASKVNIKHTHRIGKLVSFTFFIYLVHEPLMNFVKKVPLLFGRSEVVFILSYLFLPIVIYLILQKLGHIFKSNCPNSYYWFTGGR